MCKEVSEGKQYAIKPERLHTAYYLSHKGKALIKGVPLTPEILPKMGFECEEGFKFSLRWVTGGMQIIEMGHSWYPCIWSEPEMSHQEIPFVVLDRIEYVHQLQNLYHALTQKELNFEL